MTTGSTAMAMEIESLRQQLHEVALDWQVTQQQLNILKDELKLISKTIDDPRVDLTMTMSEVILEMKQQLSDHLKREVMLRKLIGEIYCSDDTGPDVMRKIEDTLNDIAELNKENGNAEL